MASVSIMQWLMLLGCGGIWLGVQIAVVSGGPRLFQRAPPELAPKGTPARFGQFWIDQYAWIGVSLSVGGAVLVALGLLS
jgi:hypothetical protein